MGVLVVVIGLGFIFISGLLFWGFVSIVGNVREIKDMLQNWEETRASEIRRKENEIKGHREEQEKDLNKPVGLKEIKIEDSRRDGER